jgi:hypothetical protein
LQLHDSYVTPEPGGADRGAFTIWVPKSTGARFHTNVTKLQYLPPGLDTKPGLAGKTQWIGQQG